MEPGPRRHNIPTFTISLLHSPTPLHSGCTTHTHTCTAQLMPCPTHIPHAHTHACTHTHKCTAQLTSKESVTPPWGGPSMDWGEGSDPSLHHTSGGTRTPCPCNAQTHPHPHPHSRVRAHTHTHTHTHARTHTHTHAHTLALCSDPRPSNTGQHPPLDQLHCEVIQLLEGVGRVGDFVRLEACHCNDTQHMRMKTPHNHLVHLLHQPLSPSPPLSHSASPLPLTIQPLPSP